MTQGSTGNKSGAAVPLELVREMRREVDRNRRQIQRCQRLLEWFTTASSPAASTPVAPARQAKPQDL